MGWMSRIFRASVCRDLYVLYLAFLLQSNRKNLMEEIKRRFFEVIEMGCLFKIFEIFSWQSENSTVLV